MTATTAAAMPIEPTFLYPKARQFPFDEVCEQIVRALEERNWKVPGIRLDFYHFESGAEKYCQVRCIKGRDFQLWFYRSQGHLGYNQDDRAAISGIIIPEKELFVHDLHPGPSLYAYVGKNWADDKERENFMYTTKIDSKLRGNPRTYLVYGADWGDSRDCPEPWPPFLLHDNNSGYEYDPEGDEPTFYRTGDLFAEFTEWLKVNLLASIVTHPIP